MKDPYVNYIGKMKVSVSRPDHRLVPFIDSYSFYENNHISNDHYLHIHSSGKVEMVVLYNDSTFLIGNGQKEIELTGFIAGIAGLKNPLKVKPVSKKDYFRGLIITFHYKGVLQLLDFPLISFTNKIVYPESVFGEKGKILLKDLSKANNNQQREHQLNRFFLMLIQAKKKSRKTIG